MIEETAFGHAIIREGPFAFDGYPLLFKLSFRGQHAHVDLRPCIVLEPITPLRPAQTAKTVAALEHGEGMPCLVIAPSLSAAQRRALTQHGVAWLVSPNTFAIPFLGASCDPTDRPRSQPERLSPNAQRIAVHLIGGDWTGRTSSELARIMGKSLSSVGNYLRELEAINPRIIATKGRTRYLDPDGMTPAELFELLAPFTTTPIKERRYYRTDAIPVPRLPLSGISALSQLTDLADDPWTTVALGPTNKLLEASAQSPFEVAETDDPNLLVETWSYATDESLGVVNNVSLLIELQDMVHKTDDERLDEAVKALRGKVLA